MSFKSVTIAISLMLLTMPLTAQVYTKLGADFHIPEFTSFYYDTVINQTRLTAFENKHSYAKGFGLQAALGYQMSKLLNAELGLSYIPRGAEYETYFKSNNFERVRNYQPNATFFLRPSVGFVRCVKKTHILITGNIGAILPIRSKIEQNELGQDGNNIDYESRALISTRISLGIYGNLGAEYKLSELLSIYFNFNVNKVDIKYDNRIVQKYIDKDQDITGQLNTNQREFNYVKLIAVQDNTDSNKPTSVPNQSFSFSSLSTSLGIKFHFGKNKNPIHIQPEQ